MDKLIFIAGYIFMGFLISFPIMLLWNDCLVPAVSILKEVSWLQMFGISVLVNFLFKTKLELKA
jgi:hypothetical protein